MSIVKIPDPITEAALGAFRSRLEERYGADLRRLVLFGSRARGDHRDDSDADVAVFLQSVAYPVAAQMDMATDAYAVFLDTGILIQPWVFDGNPEHPNRDRAVRLLDAIQAEGVML
jgi:predicted nucleotidyltransferase